MTASAPTGKEVVVRLPEHFSLANMQAFISDAMVALAAPGATGVVFDLTFLIFIEPEGVAALSNAIEYFRSQGKSVFLKGFTNTLSGGLRYLDDAGFFERYVHRTVFPGSKARPTTMPLNVFDATNYVPYLYHQVIPWIAATAQLAPDAVETVKTNLEELYHNIDFHSGLKNGCTFAEHFKARNRVHMAISDWGLGIPYNVRSVIPDIEDDAALAKAVEYGFTSTGQPNRGVGLNHLVNYFAQRNGGEVRIRSGFGMLQATRGGAKARISVSKLSWSFPGTLVHLVLRTDRLDRIEDDVRRERFEW